MKVLTIPALLGLLLTTSVFAENNAISCHGCSSQQMSAAATNAVHQGKVHVFNADSARVSTYQVINEIIDTLPWSIWKQAVPQTTPADLQNAWGGYIDARNELAGPEQIVLPDDFPVQTVAGAFMDPSFTSTHIEDYLNDLSAAQQMNVELSAVVARLIADNIPFLKLSNLLTSINLTIRFPDGSTLDYEVSFSQDAVSGETRMEIEEAGNARTADGRPAPRSRMAFSNVTIYNHNNSLREWILWARALGLVVSGPDKGATMTCEVKGNVIECIVRKRP